MDHTHKSSLRMPRCFCGQQRDLRLQWVDIGAEVEVGADSPFVHHSGRWNDPFICTTCKSTVFMWYNAGVRYSYFLLLVWGSPNYVSLAELSVLLYLLSKLGCAPSTTQVLTEQLLHHFSFRVTPLISY